MADAAARNVERMGADPRTDLFLNTRLGSSPQTPHRASNDLLPASWVADVRTHDRIAGTCEAECNSLTEERIVLSFAKPALTDRGEVEVAVSIEAPWSLVVYKYELSRSAGDAWVVKDRQMLYDARKRGSPPTGFLELQGKKVQKGSIE